MLNKLAKRKLFCAALEILERTGIELYEEEALALLREAGARTVKNRVFIKPHIIENTLQTAPKYIPIYDRDGHLVMHLGSGENYFGTGSDTPNTRDPYTGERRTSTLEDVRRFSVLADALPNIDFIMSMALPHDVPTQIADLYQLQVMTANSIKPIMFTSPDNQNTAELIQIASIIAGGEGKLRQKPFFMQYTEPSSPLRVSKDALGKLLLCAEHGIPVTFTSGVMPGASTPITVAGTIALVLAEELTGVAITQLKSPGAPVIVGGAASPLDMKTATAAYGTPESLLIDLGLCEVSKFLGMPVFSEAGYSDSKLLDEQAAVEAALSIFGMTFSEADLIHDVGYLESGIVSSPEMVVIANEIIAYAKRVKQGIDMEREHLALDAIDEIGPGGNFLTNTHTLKFFKQAYMPDLFDKRGYEHWAAAGGKSLGDRANERVKKILEAHQPHPLPEDKQNEIAGIIEKNL